MTQDLATQLRNGTAKSHNTAENTAFMKCFIKGIVEPAPFRQLLANFYFVYGTLEAELQRHQNHPVVGQIYFPQLNRKEHIAQDLAYYYGEQWASDIQPSPAGQTYVERLKTLSDTTPELLISHAYVRYLGDLSGGQGLKRIVRAAMDLPEGQGTRFYEFDEIPTFDAQKDFKIKYREVLNSLPVDTAMAEKIVEEANYAFTLNRSMMHELEGAVKAAIGEERFQEITQ